ncbi:MAG: aminotransferase class I/II-fold pyridoxal phosphate-dependent enzyme, partial [Dehalococcoidia bacterium]|nr:aminotransferase class I/II-fold pyridoxal phosphate-dependent enzyme [Dehalococcoidia bacterium]
MPPLPRPCVLGLVPAVHGGIDYEELEGMGISPDTVVDFSVCTNPFGPPPSVGKALRTVNIKCYPDSRSTRLRRALADFCGVTESNVLVSGGSTDLIRMAVLAYVTKGDAAVVPQPAYGDYEVACRLSDCLVIGQPRASGNGLRLDVEEIISVVREKRPKLLFLSNPVNPTGQYFSRTQIESILDVSGETLVVLDEAYASFVARRWSSESLIDRPNLLIKVPGTAAGVQAFEDPAVGQASGFGGVFF